MIEPTIDDLIDIYVTPVGKCIWCRRDVYKSQNYATAQQDPSKFLHYECGLAAKAGYRRPQQENLGDP